MVAERTPIVNVRTAAAFEIISIDCAGPIVLTSTRRHNFLLLILDQRTILPKCITLGKLTAHEISTTLGKFFYSIRSYRGYVPK